LKQNLFPSKIIVGGLAVKRRTPIVDFLYDENYYSIFTISFESDPPPFIETEGGTESKAFKIRSSWKSILIMSPLCFPDCLGSSKGGRIFIVFMKVLIETEFISIENYCRGFRFVIILFFRCFTHPMTEKIDFLRIWES